MAELTVSNIDEVLRALRAERGDIEKREKVRDEEYKRATKLYIKALQKETEAFERNRPNYDKRNESFKEEMKDIKERFKVGAFGLIKSNDRLHKEIDRLNSHLLEHYPKLAADVKNNLQREKEELELRLQRAKEANQRNQIPYSQVNMPSVGVMDIREKRHQLERDLRPSDTPAFTHLNPRSSQNHPAYSESHQAGQSRHSPYRGQSYLDEFVSRPNPAETQNEISRRSPQASVRPAPVDIYSQSYPQGEVRSRTPPPYDRERELRGKSKSPPRTDMLSEFMFQIPKAVFSPPQDELRRKQSPAKSESLLYSPFTGGDNDSRFSRLSSVKKSQNF